MIRRGTLEDLEILVDLDSDIDADILQQKIIAEQCLVLVEEDTIIGYLRYSLFLDRIPFLNLLHVKPAYRGLGHSAELLNYWETEMMAMGHFLLMCTADSTQHLQHFYRDSDYVDAGNFLIPGEEFQVILMKTLIR